MDLHVKSFQNWISKYMNMHIICITIFDINIADMIYIYSIQSKWREIDFQEINPDFMITM